jgi:hypothetical protein
MRDVITKVGQVDTAAAREQLKPPEMVQRTPASQKNSGGGGGSGQAKLFEVQSSATGLGIYNCIGQVIDADEWNIANQIDIFEPEGKPADWTATDWAIGAKCTDDDIRYVLENTAKTSADTDPPDVDTDWVVDPYAEVEVLNLDELQNFDDTWALNNIYTAGEGTDHSDEDYMCKVKHCAGGCITWAVGDWNIGARCRHADNAYKLQNIDKTPSDTSNPSIDGDWALDNDEPGVGNAWANYWEQPVNFLTAGDLIIAWQITDTNGDKKWAGHVVLTKDMWHRRLIDVFGAC